jgi:hypothetical protein
VSSIPELSGTHCTAWPLQQLCVSASTAEHPQSKCPCSDKVACAICKKGVAPSAANAGACQKLAAPRAPAKRRISRLVWCDALSPVCMVAVVSKQQPQLPASTRRQTAHTTNYRQERTSDGSPCEARCCVEWHRTFVRPNTGRRMFLPHCVQSAVFNACASIHICIIR